MATGLERPPWDTSKQSFNTVSPADKENREYLTRLLGVEGDVSAPVREKALSDFLKTLPTTWEGLSPGQWWNNGGVPVRVEG